MNEVLPDGSTGFALSIIIPTLNEYTSIAANLSQWQLLRQAACEIIIVDGGSSDDSLTLVDGKVDQLVLSDKGRARQMNKGAELASARWLLFLHVDTQLPTGIAGFIDQLQREKPSWGFFNLRLSGEQGAFRLIEWAINLRSGLTSVATGDQCLFVRADVFGELAGFADMPLMEDVEITKRLRRREQPLIVQGPVVTSSRRWQYHGITKTVLLMWYLRLAYFFGVSPARLAQAYYGKR